MSARTILRVAVPAPLLSEFDYLPPEACDRTRLQPGIRMWVPFGRGRRCGVLLGLTRNSDLAPDRLKRVSQLIDPEPLFTLADLKFLKWAAGYYQHPVGEVVAAALPTRLRRGEQPVKLSRSGWRIAPDGAVQDVEALLTRAPRQARILAMLQAVSSGLAQDEIYRRCGQCRAVLRRMLEKGWLQPCDINPEPGTSLVREQLPGPPLNDAQRTAVAAVEGGLGRFAVFLLEGVTGSGKTEVYLKLAQQVIAAGRQVLILVPEIGLTPQLLHRFRHRLPVPIAVLHSGLSETEREKAWHQARLGHARLVLGTRSALFTPLPELGLIVVDEEHDLALKQQEGFRYSARDLGVIRAQQAACPVLLGSATPSLESLKNALEGRYHRLQLVERAGGAKAPRLDLLDIRSTRLEAGLAPRLVRQIEQELAERNQVLLFLNRRGYAPLLTCHDCGWVAQCQRCDSRMTFHLTNRQLWCHHCGVQRPVADLCPQCGEKDLRLLGQGTQRLYEVLRQRFPDRGIARIDRDSTRSKGSLEQLLERARKGEYSLLLGTQMLAKGHHFPDVTLVGVLDVDQGLFGADYRAAERMAQLIVQVAGRAGRESKAGRVIIQTRHPDHPLLKLLLRSGYDAFARECLVERREALLPPYSYQVLLRAEAHRSEAPDAFLGQAATLAHELAAGQEIEIWGPVPAPMERRAGRFRAHLLLQARQRSRLQGLMAGWVPQLQSLATARRVRWSLDVDPQEMF